MKLYFLMLFLGVLACYSALLIYPELPHHYDQLTNPGDEVPRIFSSPFVFLYWTGICAFVVGAGLIEYHVKQTLNSVTNKH